LINLVINFNCGHDTRKHVVQLILRICNDLPWANPNPTVA